MGPLTAAVDPTQARARSHAPCQLEERQDRLEHDRLPRIHQSPPKMGFQFNDTVSLMTGNGNNAPFETTPPSSTLQVCVIGGDDVPYSVTNANITLVFGGPATAHFGTQAIHGVVREASRSPFEDRSIGRSMNACG